MKCILQKIMPALMAIILISAVSCDKKDDDSSNIPKCFITGYNAIISEVNDEWSDSWAEAVDFTYDIDKILIKWEFVGNNEFAQIVYNSDGKIEKIEDYKNGELSYWYTCTWNESKMTLQGFWMDEHALCESSWKDIYFYNANNEIVKIQEFEKEGNSWIIYWYEEYTWLNGNIILQEAYHSYNPGKSNKIEAKRNSPFTFPYNKSPRDKRLIENNLKGTSVVFVKYRIINFTYDNKYNPFSPHKALNYFATNTEFTSKNNIVSETRHYPYEVDGLYTKKCEYVYNDKNFPIQMTRSETLGSNSRKTDMDFKYDFE